MLITDAEDVPSVQHLAPLLIASDSLAHVVNAVAGFTISCPLMRMEKDQLIAFAYNLGMEPGYRGRVNHDIVRGIASNTNCGLREWIGLPLLPGIGADFERRGANRSIRLCSRGLESSLCAKIGRCSEDRL